MGFLRYKGYDGSVEFSAEDNCLFGKVQGLRSMILYEGSSLEELRKDFEGAIDDYLESCQARNISPEKPYEGELTVHMPSELYARVADVVASAGMTINDFINKAIVNELKQECAM